MRSLHAKRWLASALISMVGALSCGVAWAAKPVAKPAQPAQSQQPSQQFVDGIAAVVNKHVITLQQVNTQAQLAQAQLRDRKSVGEGKSGSVRVNLGGRRHIKKKK